MQPSSFVTGIAISGLFALTVCLPLSDNKPFNTLDNRVKPDLTNAKFATYEFEDKGYKCWVTVPAKSIFNTPFPQIFCYSKSDEEFKRVESIGLDNDTVFSIIPLKDETCFAVRRQTENEVKVNFSCLKHQ